MKGVPRVNALLEIADHSTSLAKKWVDRADSQKRYATAALVEAERINYRKGIAKSLAALGGGDWFYSIPVIQQKKDASEFLKRGEGFLLRALTIAEQLNDNSLLASIYESLSLQEYLYNDNTYKVKNFQKAAFYYNKAGNKTKEGEVSTWLCEDFRSRGLFEEGIQYCNRSMQLSEGAFRKETVKEDRDYRIWQEWNSINNMAELYKLAGDYETAKHYVLKAKNFAAKYKTDFVPGSYAQLAQLFVDMGRLDSARFYLNKTSLSSYGPGNEFWYRLGKANILVALNEADSAISVLKPPFESFNQGKFSWRVLLPLAKAYNTKGNNAEALRLATESFSRVGRDQRLDLMNHYQVLSKIHAGLKNYDSAYIYLTKYYDIKDGMLNRQYLWQLNKYKTSAADAKRIAELALLQRENLIKEQQIQQHLLLQQATDSRLAILNKDNLIKGQELLLKDQRLKEQEFVRQQKESALALLGKDNKLKDQQLKQQTFIRNALLAGLFLLLVLGFVAIRFLTLKRRNERLQNEKRQAELQQQSAELHMQALRAQMNPHFIFNCLSSINKFILKNESRAASDYLTRFSRLIRTVLTNSQLSKIPLSDEVDMLRLYLDMERLRFDNGFNYNIIFTNNIEPESIYVPPMLLQPLCENAIWHGLMHKDGQGKLEVLLSSKNDVLQCEIIDNGVGRTRAAELKSKTSETHKSFGLKMTTERLALFNSSSKENSCFHVEDIFDVHGAPAGTKITLQIRNKQYQQRVENEFA